MASIATWLPIIIMGESFAAAALYLLAGDWKHAGYWFSAAAITFFVTI